MFDSKFPSLRIISGMVSLGLISCSSVPRPAEFAQAQADIDSAKKWNAGDYFPLTLGRAEARLEKAEELFDEAVDAEFPAAKTNGRNAAIQEATKASELARSTQEHLRLAKAWDADNDQGMVEEVVTTTPVFIEREQEAPEPLIKTKTVAFFPTASDKIKENRKGSIEEIANALKERPEWSVQLIGYADARGTKAFNKSLAKARVDAVKAELVKYGVEGSRLAEKPVGELTDKISHRRELPLERRVDVRFYDTAKASQDAQQTSNEDRG